MHLDLLQPVLVDLREALWTSSEGEHQVAVARSVLLTYLGVRDVVDHNDTVGAAEVRVRHCLEPAPQDDGTRTFCEHDDSRFHLSPLHPGTA